MSIEMNRRNLLLSGGATLIAAAVAACSSSSGSGAAATSTGSGSVTSKSLVPLRIPDPGNSGVLAVGKKNGSLAKALAAAGAQAVWTGTAGPFAPAALEIDANELDVAQGSITSAVTSLAAVPGFKLFSQIEPDRYGEGVLVRQDSPIKTVHDLAGKKVAVNKGGTGEYLLLKALSWAGIPVSQVTRVYLNPAETAPVFSAGQVDAWATWATYSVAAVAQGARFVAQAGQFGSQNYSVWAVRSGLASEHPQVLAAFYQYLHSTTLQEIANPGAYVNVFTDAGPQALDTAEITVNNEFSSKGSTVNPVGATEVSAFETVAAFFAAQQVTSKEVSVTPYIVAPSALAPAGSS
jgi:sulfonate transport system substrate-binding protein